MRFSMFLGQRALRRQLQTVLGAAAAQVDIRTFHSFGLRVIRAWSHELGFGQTPSMVVSYLGIAAVLYACARYAKVSPREDEASARTLLALPAEPSPRT